MGIKPLAIEPHWYCYLDADGNWKVCHHGEVLGDCVIRERRRQMTECAWCGRPITWKRRLLRLFWAPWWCSMSFVWRTCCSAECAENQILHQLNSTGVSYEDWARKRRAR